MPGQRKQAMSKKRALALIAALKLSELEKSQCDSGSPIG